MSFSKERMETAAVLNDQIATILDWHKPEFVNYRFTTFEEDISGYDIKIELLGEHLGVRVRTPDCRYRDLTIRTTSGNGVSERDKILAGHVHLYLYCWTSSPTKICEYVLVNLRIKGILTLVKTAEEIKNKDGSGFIALSMDSIQDAILYHHRSTHEQ